MGNSLKTLDNNVIGDDERGNSAQWVKKQQDIYTDAMNIMSVDWGEITREAMEKAYEFAELRRRKAKKYRKLMPSDVDTGKKQKGKESQPDDEDEDTNEGLKGNFLEDDDDDIAEIDSEEVEVEAEVEGPQMEENVLQSTGAMITKFEVFVSFLQVYGIIFNFDLTIDWPINFKLFNMWFMWMPTLFF